MKNTFVVSLLLLSFVLSASALQAGENKKAKAGNSTFMIQSSHTQEDCMKVLDAATKDTKGYLSKCYWECMSGDHTAYSVVTAKSEETARNMIPALVRSKAKIIKVDQFSAAQIASFHKH